MLQALVKKLQPPKSLPESLFPSRALSSILFKIDSPITFTHGLPIYKECYKALITNTIPDIPENVRAFDLLILQRALERYRKETSATNAILVKVERILLEESSARRNNDATSILAFNVLNDPSSDETDKAEAKNILDKLYDLKHPMTIKLMAAHELDQASASGSSLQRAEQLCLEYINLKTISKSEMTADVYKMLGIISFQNLDLFKALNYFENCIKYTSLNPYDVSTPSINSESRLQSHYYLGQIYQSTNPSIAKYYYTEAAKSGMLDAISALGFLELKEFKNVDIAKEWFRLGLQLTDINCGMGLFDVLILKKDWLNAYKQLQFLNLMFSSKGNKAKDAMQLFIETRKESLEILKTYVEENPQLLDEVRKPISKKKKESRLKSIIARRFADDDAPNVEEVITKVDKYMNLKEKEIKEGNK